MQHAAKGGATAGPNDVRTRRGAVPERHGTLAAFEWLFARLGFPLVIVGAIAYAIGAMASGTPPAQAMLPPTIGAYLLLLVIERLVYWREAWLHSAGDVHVDLGHLFVSGIFANQIATVPVVYLAVLVAGEFEAAIGFGLWPTHWSLWLQLPVALVFGEFFLYWIHRLTHEIDFLWRFHATHHSAPRLYFLNAARFHPVDLLLSSLLPIAALLVVGADARIVALHGLFSAVHGLFQHANVVIHAGPLNWIFSLAELHRWHHSRVLEESNTNFGQNLIVWDVVFGTRFLPADREPPDDIGLAGLPSFPMGYWAQLVSPLRWRTIRAESAAMGGGPSIPADRAAASTTAISGAPTPRP